MNDLYNDCLWKNFGASMDMLKNVVELCPDTLWEAQTRFYYTVYHTTVFLDFYLTIPTDTYRPVLPFTLCDEKDMPPYAVDDVIPDRLYSRQEVLDYLAAIRLKCKQLITTATTATFAQRWLPENDTNKYGLYPPQVKAYSVLEIVFYNFRHLQHHVGQLNMLLRQTIGKAPDWVSLAG